MSTVAITRTSGRTLQGIGTLAAVLSLAILCASVLLRLATVFDSSGQAISTLPRAIEEMTRLIHRAAASGVGLLALAAVVLCWWRRPNAAETKRATGVIAVTTIILAAIGPLTPGYRFAAVTVANVVGGIVLLMACWWLRETLATARAERPYRDALLYSTLAVFLLHVGTGAANSALDAQAMRWPVFAHAGTAMLATIFIGGTLWERRCDAAAGRVVWAMTALLCVQVALGLVALWIAPRPLWLGFAHAVLSALMAAGLVSIAVRADATGRPQPTPGSVQIRRGVP